MKEKIVAVWGKLICDPLSADKPEAEREKLSRAMQALSQQIGGIAG